jgi:hypothetical protein
MAYRLECRDCAKSHPVASIRVLVEERVGMGFRFTCPECGSVRTFLPQKNTEMVALGAIPLTGSAENDFPYVLLLGDREGDAIGLKFGLYRDLSGEGGGLRHGSSAPVLGTQAVWDLLDRLPVAGFGVVESLIEPPVKGGKKKKSKKKKSKKKKNKKKKNKKR